MWDITEINVEKIKEPEDILSKKLVVMIPAYNEEETIGGVIREIPRSIDGFETIDVIVTNDGSVDGTKEVALEAGAALVVSHRRNRGLAATFRTGLKFAIKRGADVIVNTDADLQYDQRQIPDLVSPIVLGNADMVLGSRFKGWIEHMPRRKRMGNMLATCVTRILSGFSVSDAQSGFRAFNREVAEFLRVTSTKTYVQETIIRPARKGFRIVEIPITFRKREGESRLIKSIWGYAFHVLPELVSCYIDTFRPTSK
jgi:glycosyltransferase involved in cell wall biosynthesis